MKWLFMRKVRLTAQHHSVRRQHVQEKKLKSSNLFFLLASISLLSCHAERILIFKLLIGAFLCVVCMFSPAGDLPCCSQVCLCLCVVLCPGVSLLSCDGLAICLFGFSICVDVQV
ncbi:hypothetical protein CRENBAI_004432 [Crenichthys baileyi]|uniref:Uncharacterized protein n=1 Tax=Crenichthys baileyi TaxID=28760 RepID=A0AAV9SNA8_9TELE